MSAIPFCRWHRAVLFACGRCDFHFLDRLDPPAANDETESDTKLSRDGRAYIEARLGTNERLLRERLELVRHHAALQGARCLDVGAGVGQYLDLLDKAGAYGEGIEPSGLRREFAAQYYGLKLEGRTLGDDYWRKKPGGCFDIATLWDVIEHVNFPRETLAEAFRLLRPGGLIFIETPSRDSFWYRISAWSCRHSAGRIPLLLANFYPLVPYGHKQIFRPGQLRQTIEACGFEILALEGSHRAARRVQSRERGPRPALSFAVGNPLVLVARKPG
jgi:2-polyprenyl-6-hydroxyphenyl methylase/3-demethylubiquinone-9 3-methyltransferase